MSNGAISGKAYGSGLGIGAAGATTILLMYILKATFNIDPPPEVDQAVTTLLGIAGGFIGSYAAPHNESQPTNNGTPPTITAG
jgi:hypothetical protein